jgi:hypothetical protein
MAVKGLKNTLLTVNVSGRIELPCADLGCFGGSK